MNPGRRTGIQDSAVELPSEPVSSPKVPRHSAPDGSAGREEGKSSVVSPTDETEDDKHSPIQSKQLFTPPEEATRTTRGRSMNQADL